MNIRRLGARQGERRWRSASSTRKRNGSRANWPSAGESLTAATRRALEDRLRRIRHEQRGAQLLEDLAAIRRRVRSPPKFDEREADGIIGYDENRLPGCKTACRVAKPLAGLQNRLPG